MPKKDQCFRTPRYVQFSPTGAFYCACRSQDDGPEAVAWFKWNSITKRWHFVSIAKSAQSALWLSPSHYGKIVTLPADIPECKYLTKEY